MEPPLVATQGSWLLCTIHTVIKGNVAFSTTIAKEGLGLFMMQLGIRHLNVST